MRRRPTLAGWLLAIVSLIPGCKNDRQASPGVAEDGRPLSLPDTASDAGAVVAHRIVKAATLEEAISATREALLKGGLTISDLNGKTESPAEPASDIIILPPEAVLLAYEAKQRPAAGRMTLDEFAGMLADFGWPFEGEGMPGDQLMAVMAEWVRQARLAPDEPRNFAPLFMADMGRRQIPARGSAEPVQTGYLNGTRVTAASYGATHRMDACADIRRWLNTGLTGKAAGAGVKYQVSQELKQALVKSGLTEAAAKQVSQALSALKSALKIVKLSELYGSANIVLDHASDLPAERPAPGGDVYASVRARAGLATDEQKQYQESLKSTAMAKGLRDCLEAAGLPTWSDVSDVSAAVDRWRVHWYLGKGAPKHAVHVRERNDWFAYGQRSMLLKRTSPASGEAVYTFKLVPERVPGHPGHDLKSEVTVRAELHTAQPPGLGTVASAAFGPLGLVKSLVEAGAGWFQEMLTFDSYITVPVVYHERGISILIEDENHVVLQFGEKGKHLFATKGAERSRHVYAGSIHMADDSLWHGQILVTVNGTYTTADEKAVKALVAKYSNIENMTWNQLWAAVGDLIDDIPTCNGAYHGAQIFAVEGSFVTGKGGKDQVGLAFIPVGPPEFYETTSSCPWPAEQGNKGPMLPTRLVRGEEVAITIDPPVLGQSKVYREGMSMPNLFSSTVTTVGADFKTGD